VAKETTNLLQGTLDLLILKTLSLEPLHGFGIGRRIEDISRGVFKVNPGSLLVALKRLERSGWLDAEWRESPNARRAKYYRLTRTGRRQLEIETADWNAAPAPSRDCLAPRDRRCHSFAQFAVASRRSGTVVDQTPT